MTAHLTDVDPIGRALEADGRLLCSRCRCELDEDFNCAQCGVTSRPPAFTTRPLNVLTTEDADAIVRPPVLLEHATAA